MVRDGGARVATAEGIRYEVLHSHSWLSALAARDRRETFDAPILHMFQALA